MKLTFEKSNWFLSNTVNGICKSRTCKCPQPLRRHTGVTSKRGEDPVGAVKQGQYGPTDHRTSFREKFATVHHNTQKHCNRRKIFLRNQICRSDIHWKVIEMSRRHYSKPPSDEAVGASAWPDSGCSRCTCKLWSNPVRSAASTPMFASPWQQQ